MKPRILLLADVPNWAWARRAAALKRWLSDEFDIAIRYHAEDGWEIAPRAFDLIHTFEVSQIPNISTRIPLVSGVTAHVLSTWETAVERGFGPGTVKRWADKAVALHANSRMLQAELSALLSRPVHYLPNGVDEAFFHRTRPHPVGSLIAGWVGKPNPRKGLAIAREACERAGVELRTVERRSGDALSPEEMREFYQDIHVLLVASDMDGTPNPMLEAAACGVMTIANRIGNAPEFLEGNLAGALVERREADAYASALRVLGANPSIAVEMGRCARVAIDAAWTWRHQAENYRAMWRECLR